MTEGSYGLRTSLRFVSQNVSTPRCATASTSTLLIRSAKMTTKPYLWTLAHQLKNHKFEPPGAYTLALENLSYFEPQLVEDQPEEPDEPALLSDSYEVKDRIQALWEYCDFHNILSKYQDVILEIYFQNETSEAQLRHLLDEEAKLNVAEKNKEPRSYDEAQKLINELEQELQAKRTKI